MRDKAGERRAERGVWGGQKGRGHTIFEAVW